MLCYIICVFYKSKRAQEMVYATKRSEKNNTFRKQMWQNIKNWWTGEMAICAFKQLSYTFTNYLKANIVLETPTAPVQCWFVRPLAPEQQEGTVLPSVPLRTDWGCGPPGDPQPASRVGIRPLTEAPGPVPSSSLLPRSQRPAKWEWPSK